MGVCCPSNRKDPVPVVFSKETETPEPEERMPRPPVL